MRIKILTKLSIFTCALLLFFCFLQIHTVHAATITWGGGGSDNNWSTCANWVGNSCPGVSDIATFDGTSTKNATIDASFAGSVSGVAINSGYTGIVTQARSLTISSSNFTIAAGRFTGSSDAISIDSSFLQTGGVFTSTSGTLRITGSFSTSTGTFNHNNGTVNFAMNTYGGSTITCGSTTFNTVAITSNYYGTTIASGCVIPLGANPTTALGTLINNGTITVSSGTWTDTGGNSNVTNNGTITNSGSGWNWSGEGLIMGPSGVVNYSGTSMTIGHDLDVHQGTFPSGLNITFYMNVYGGSTITCGSTTFNTVAITANYYGTTIASGCVIPLGANPTNYLGFLVNNGTITVSSGTWTDTGSNSKVINNGTITNSGSGWNWPYEGLIMGPSGVVNYSGTSMTIGHDFDVHQGTFPSGLNITFHMDTYGGSTITCGSTTFNTVAINTNNYGITIASGCVIPLGANPTTVLGNLTNNGTITVSSGTWTDSGINSNVTNNGTITNSGSGWNWPNEGLIMGPSGVVNYSGTSMTIGRDFDVHQGTFPSGLNITFAGNVWGGSTITCGTVSFAQMIINPAGAISFGSSCTDTGDFTYGSGGSNISNPSSPYTLTVQGNFTQTSAGTFGGSNLTVLLSGSTSSTLSLSAGTFNSPLQISKTGSGVAQLTSAFTVTGQTCTVSSGTFDLNAQAFTCGSTFTIQNGGTLMLVGSESPTAPTLNTGSTVIYKGNGNSSADSYSLKNWSYSNLTANLIDSVDTLDASGISPLTITGSFALSHGIFKAPATLNVAADFNNSGGTFNANSGTVVLNGTNQHITGSTTFSNLTKNTSSTDTLTFPAGQTQIITGTMNFQGASSNLLSLLSSSSPTQFNIDPQGTRTISYLYVKDSNNINTNPILVSGFHVTNGGNNTNWLFNQNPNTPTTLGPSFVVSGGVINTSTPNFTFNLSDPDNGDTLKFELILASNSSFTSPLIDYTSALATQGVTSFTVGQAAGGGSYTAGNQGQILADSSVGYYWEVKAIDNSNASSSFALANNGAVAFKVDTVVPTIPHGHGHPSAPILSSINVSNITNTSATITWNTDQNSDSQVNYGLSNNYSLNTNIPTETTFHTVILNNLKANTLYHFQVQSISSSINLKSISADYTFVTTETSTSTPTTITNRTYNFGTTTLRNKSRGAAVKQLQLFLNKYLNLGLVIDGVLGPKTIAVIKQWQKKNGLVPDGLIGPKTKEKMYIYGASH